VAFTYLSLAKYVDAARRSPHRRWFAWFRRAAPRLNRWGGPGPTKPSDAGAASGGDREDAADAPILDSSAMMQFAQDAFPGLEAARESPFDKAWSLFWVLVILLAMTCFVS
jgi:hypothetical protein